MCVAAGAQRRSRSDRRSGGGSECAWGGRAVEGAESELGIDIGMAGRRE